MMPIAMMTVSALAAVNTARVFSPLRNPCKKRVAPSRFRYEPYGACVLAASTESPSKYAFGAAATESIFAAPRPVEPVAVSAAPVSPKAVASSVRFAFVQFKHESATFLAPFRIFAGDVVVVEGDRGENIGVVSEITKVAPTYPVTAKIIRRASDKDREALAVQRSREVEVTRATAALAESLGLHGRVEDAEYQFDMNKLTIFVRRPTKNTFVDFRKLQRSLFREFRCRIWCAYMDEVEAAEAGPRSR